MKIIGIDPGMSKASTVCMLNDNNEIVIEDYNHDRLRNLCRYYSTLNSQRHIVT
jgi:aspartate/glutamate racemase